MPFIDNKLSLKLTDAQKETLKTRLGKAVSAIGKGESYLMVGIEDGVDLYFAGKKLARGAYVSVSLFGASSPANYARMTGLVCDILEEELGIPKNAVYVTYHEVENWGFNGGNF